MSCDPDRISVLLGGDESVVGYSTEQTTTPQAFRATVIATFCRADEIAEVEVAPILTVACRRKAGAVHTLLDLRGRK